MAISAQGIGSGIDVNSIVSQLGAIERQALKPLQTKAGSLQSQLSLYGKIKSQASSLADAAADLALSSAWSSPKATSSNSAAIDAKVSAGASAASLSIQATQLARGQSSATMAMTAGQAVGAQGTLTIAIGSWADGASERTFAPDASKTPVSVTVNAGDNLATIADKINSSSAGVSASVIKDGDTERLLLRSSTTGAASGFSISTNTEFGGLDAFSLTSPASKTATNGDSSGMFISQSAQNAQLNINGLSISSSSNTVENVVPGVTLMLNQATTTPVEVSVTNDQEAVKSKIQAVLDAYNTLNQTLADATKYDAATKKGAPLQGDSMTLGIQSALRGMLASSSAGSNMYTILSDVGIERQTDGSLKMNTKKLNAAMSNLPELQKLFTSNNNDSMNNGFALKIRDFSRGLVGFDGRVTSRTAGIQKSISNNQDDQDRVNARADRVEAALRRQYSALDTKMSQMGGLTSFVSSQVAQWNKSSG